jgi:hypothetical protein
MQSKTLRNLSHYVKGSKPKNLSKKLSIFIDKIMLINVLIAKVGFEK